MFSQHLFRPRLVVPRAHMSLSCLPPISSGCRLPSTGLCPCETNRAIRAGHRSVTRNAAVDPSKGLGPPLEGFGPQQRGLFEGPRCLGRKRLFQPKITKGFAALQKSFSRRVPHNPTETARKAPCTLSRKLAPKGSSPF